MYYALFIVSVQYSKFILGLKDNIFLLYFVTFIRCFKFPNSVVVRFIVTFTKFPIRHLNPHVYYCVEKMQQKKSLKRQRISLTRIQKIKKTYHSYFLKYLRNLLETIAKLGTLSFIICFCKITSCFCHIIYIQFHFLKFMFYC